MAQTFRSLLKRRAPARSGSTPLPMTSANSGITTSRARVDWERAIVLSVARSIEPDSEKVTAWFSSDSIIELGGKTAQQLIEEGATAQLLDMLMSIRSGRRDR